MSVRGSQRVDRRRRALADESRNADAATLPRIFREDAAGPACRYNAAALDAINAPIARYLPTRPFNLVLWFLIGLIPVLGVLWLDAEKTNLAGILGTNAYRIFDAQSPGSLAAWLSSTYFASCALIMLGIYSVRRHRRDDYDGNFTVWCWAIVAAFFASLDCGVGIHALWQSAMEVLTGTTLWNSHASYWLLTWIVVFGIVLARLVFEMWSSRPALSFCGAAVACYAWSAFSRFNAAEVPGDTTQYAQTATALLGHHLFIFSIVTYAREVVLEAMGLLASPAVRREEKTQKAENLKADEKNKSASSERSQKNAAKTASVDKKPDETHTTIKMPPPVEQPQTTTDHRPTKSPEEEPRILKAVEQSEAEDDSPPRKLSKSERRRLRKEQKRRKAA